MPTPTEQRVPEPQQPHRPLSSVSRLAASHLVICPLEGGGDGGAGGLLSVFEATVKPTSAHTLERCVQRSPTMATCLCCLEELQLLTCLNCPKDAEAACGTCYKTYWADKPFDPPACMTSRHTFTDKALFGVFTKSWVQKVRALAGGDWWGTNPSDRPLFLPSLRALPLTPLSYRQELEVCRRESLYRSEANYSIYDQVRRAPRLRPFVVHPFP